LKRWLGSVIAVAALPAAVVGVRTVWNSDFCSVRDQLVPRHFETVLPGALYRSGQISPRLIGRVLADRGIGVVIDLSSEVPDSAEQRAERDAVERLGVEYHRFPLHGDGTGDVPTFAAAIAAIERAERREQRVLVHCVSGDKRSGAVIAAWMLLFRGATAGQAMEQIGLCNKGRVPSCTVVAFLNAQLREIAAELENSGVAAASTDPLPTLVGGG
jgi:protein-tyrosine phosphatase